MEYVSGAIACVVAFITGFFGHVVAHDFCEVAPMLSSKIIEAAAAHLPTMVRDRYLNEWRADLYDQPGAIAKLTWSFGCLWSVYQIRRQAEVDRLRRTSWRLVLNTGGTVEIDGPTIALVIFVGKLLIWGFRSRLLRWLPSRVGGKLIAYTSQAEIYRLRRYGSPDTDKAFKLVADMGRGAWKFTRYFDGVEVASGLIGVTPKKP